MNRRQERLAETHGHSPRVSRHNIGTSPRGGAVYGTTCRCGCGWKTTSNKAPSKGGNADVLGRWERHAEPVVLGRWERHAERIQRAP